MAANSIAVFRLFFISHARLVRSPVERSPDL